MTYWAMQNEMMAEDNGAADYHSELWASEREDLRFEGFYNQMAELDADLAAGYITKSCHLIRTRRITMELEAAEAARRPPESPEHRQDRIIDAMFSPGGSQYHTMRNEDNGPEY